MTLVNAMDIVIAQTEKAIQANAKERTLALEDGDIVQYERMERCSRRLNSLHSKLIVARAEVTDLSIHGCKAVFTELEELPMTKIQATEDDIPNEFIQDENGEWNSDKDRQLGVPNTFYKIAIEEKHSYFDKTRIRYSVITVGTDERGYPKDFTLKRFISRKHAQAFADKLAEMLNEQED